MAKVFYSTF